LTALLVGTAAPSGATASVSIRNKDAPTSTI
jgi:hypothetical protein